MARASRAGPDDRAQGAGDPSLAADHLADVVLRHVQLQHNSAFALDLVDPNRLRVVDESTGELGQQLSQCS